jgi:acyl-CoA synthetase (AMP-forming)/AMP-acid ligase II
MILGDTRSRSAHTDAQTTLDDIFRRAASRRPDAIALCDPPNRTAFTDGAPRRLTYRQADRIIDAIAGRLRKLGLQADAVVGIALANTVESVLTVLAVMRSGMIAAPLPLLWRHAEAKAALERIGAKAIITTARIGGLEPSDVAMKVASELFQIRYVCGYGAGLPDGVVPFDDLLADGTAGEPPPAHKRDSEAALNVALVTFDVTPDGLVAVARNHAELIAGGLAVLLEGGLQQDAVILAGTALGSFSGLALQVVPWLLSGGTLCLHHAFDAETFAAQGRSERCDTVTVPAPLVPRLAAAGLLAHPELHNVLAVWRTPERISSADVWQHPAARMIDVLVFGEAAFLAARRRAHRQPLPLPPGDKYAPVS